MENQKEMENKNNQTPFVITVNGETDSSLLRLVVGVFRAAIQERQKQDPIFAEQMTVLVPIVADSTNLNGGFPCYFLRDWLEDQSCNSSIESSEKLLFFEEIQHSFSQAWSRESFLFQEVSTIDFFVDRRDRSNTKKSVNLFEDSNQSHFITRRGNKNDCFQLLEKIITEARYWAKQISAGYMQVDSEKIWEKSGFSPETPTAMTEHPDKTTTQQNEPKTETMDALLRSLDLSYSQDVSVFEQAMKAALFDLFSGKPSDDWHEWLLGCFVTGMQARLPEVALIWEQCGKQQTKSGEHVAQRNWNQFQVRND